MPKVLMLSYSFPPEGGPAVQRMSKFAKYLPQFGYQPIVLTSKHPLKTYDESLFKEVRNIPIYKTADPGSYLPGEIRKWFKRFFIPDKQILWKKTSLRKALRIIEEEKVDLIFSSSPPHSVHLLALALKEKTALPWVADFRDEWTQNPDFREDRYSAGQRKFEKDVVKSCDHITVTTATAKENFSTNYPGNPVTVIPNGFDPDDLPENITTCQKPNKTFNIIYAGRLNNTHNPESLFKALSGLKSSNSELMAKIRLDIYGPDGNRKWLKNFPDLNSCLGFRSYRPHQDILQRMAMADMTLLLATGMGKGGFIPAKIYEYFYLRKPIFAVMSDNQELKTLLERYGPVYIGYENNLQSVIEALEESFRDWRQSTKKEVSEDFVKQFSRKNLTEQLAGIFRLYDNIQA